MDSAPGVNQHRLSTATVARRNLLLLSAPLVAAAYASQPTSTATAQTTAPSGSRLDRILRAQKLRIGTFLQYKPFTFKNEKGEPDGHDTELAKALCADMGVQPEFIDNTWDGIIPALQADKFDVIIACMSPTKKRSLVVQYTNLYYMGFHGFVYRTGDKGRFPTLESFNKGGHKASLLIQDAAHQTLQRFFPLVKIDDYNSADESMLAVQTKKSDFTVQDYVYGLEYAAAHPGLSVKAIDYPGAGIPIAMGLTATPDNYHFKEFLDTWIKHYFWSGQNLPIFKKWFKQAPVPKVNSFDAPL